MKLKNFFLQYYVLIFVAISLIFSLFIFQTGIGIALLMLIFATLVTLLYAISWAIQTKDKKTKKPYLQVFLFCLGFILVIVIFYNNLESGLDHMKMKGLSLAFHLFLGTLVAFIDWYIDRKK